jgi:hypothetical protein
MKDKSIVIEIDELGNSSIDLEGFQGRGCADVAKDFQGSDAVKSVRNKREFYVQSAAGKPQQRQA